MPAPLELSCWVFPPGNAKRPVVIRDQEIRIYLRAVAENGTPGELSGVRLEVRRPDGTVQVIDGNDIEAGEEPGTLFGRVQADQNRLWRYEWIHTGPVEGHINGTFTVQSGRVTPPGPDNPILTTEDLDPLATEGGGILRVKRITALPEAATPAGFRVLGVQGGQAKNIAVDGLVEGAVGDQLAPVVAGLSGKLDRSDDEVTGDLRVPSVPATARSAVPREWAEALAEEKTRAELVVDGGQGAPPGQVPTGDQTSVAVSAAAELKSRYGGGRLVFTRSMSILGQVVLPPEITAAFRGAPNARRTQGFDSTGIADVPAIYCGPDGFFTPQQGMENFYFLPSGYSTLPTGDREPGLSWNIEAQVAALDLQAGMDGRGCPIRILGGNNPRPEGLTISRITAMGMRSIIETNGAHGNKYEDIQGDCNNGIVTIAAGTGPTIKGLEVSGILTPRNAVAVACRVEGAANVAGKLALICGKPRLPPYRQWEGNKYVGDTTKLWWEDKYYRVNGSGMLDNVPPTHTQGRRVHGDVLLAYQGPWINGAIGPATVIPFHTGGFLKVGHYLFCSVPPRDTYTGNTTYPHWSTPGAPPEIAIMGGDIGDPAMRGCYRVDSFGSVTEDFWTVVLDVPYDLGLATAHIGREIQAMPLARLGAIYRSDESTDGTQIFGLNGKGPRFDLLVEGSSHQIHGATTEQPAQGELAIDDFGAVGIWAGRGASRLVVTDWILKSKGTLAHIAVRNNSWVNIKGIFRGARFRAIHHVSGYAKVDANFEGNSAIYTEPTARGMELDWRGNRPVVVGPDENASKRVVGTGTRAWPSTSQRAAETMGGNGFVFGTGFAFPDWAPATSYNNGAVVKNQVFTTEDGTYYLYRMTASGTQQSAATGDGPQHTSGGATDGTCTWLAIGVYGGGVKLLYTDPANQEVVIAAKTIEGFDKEVIRAKEAGPLLTGRIDQVRANGQTGTIVTDDGYLRLRARSVAQLTAEAAPDAGSGLVRMAVASNAPGGSAVAHSVDGGPPIISATQDWVAANTQAPPITLTGTAATTGPEAPTIALTTTGTAAAGTSSGFGVTVNDAGLWVTLSIRLQRLGGLNQSERRESATFSIPLFLQRASNGASLMAYREGDAPLTGIAPKVAPGGGLAGARINLSIDTVLSTLIVDLVVSGLAVGKVVAATGHIMPFGVPEGGAGVGFATETWTNAAIAAATADLATDGEVAAAVAAATADMATDAEVASAISGALAPYPAPAILTWVGNTAPLPPQAFSANAGNSAVTAQQSILSAWLLACQAERRSAFLPAGIYRLSGAEQIATILRVPVVMYGVGPRRSIIWMDDTYSGGAALRFDDIWWGATEIALPTNLQPAEADGYVAGAPPLTSGQSFRGGLLLRDFSVIGQMTSLTTKAWLDGSLDQRGMDFTRRLDNAYIGGLHFANIQGQAMRFRPSTATTVGPRESTIEVIDTRQCGWGSARPVIDILNDRVDAGGSDQMTLRRIKGSNNHGPTLRIQHNGGDGFSSMNHWLVDDLLVHGEGSWNAGAIGYDPAVPLPGGAPWHHMEFLGAIDSLRAINLRVGHNIHGRDDDPDGYCIRIAAVGGAVPNGMLLTAQNRDSGEKFLLIEAGTGIRCEISSAEGGLVTVGPGITGPVEIVPPPGEVLNLSVDPAVQHLVGMAQVDQTSTLPARVPAVEAAIRAKVGSGRTVARERHALYARTDGTTTTAGFGPMRDANVGVVSGVGRPAQVIGVDAAGMALMVYRARGTNTGAQRAEWWGVVLVQRLTDAASTTILAGAAASRAPNESSGTTANAARLAVAADTTIGGVTFAATWGGVADLTLDLQVFRLGQVFSGNVASAQRMLENAAGAAIAGLLRQRPSGPYADDAAAISAGVARGSLYYKPDGTIAAVGESGAPAPATISYVTERELAPARQVVVTAATALTVAAHQDARVTLAAGGSFSLAAATLGDGFRAVVVNLTGADYTIAGITGGTVRYDGNAAHTKIASGRSALIEVYSVSGTRYVDITGGTIA